MVNDIEIMDKLTQFHKGIIDFDDFCLEINANCQRLLWIEFVLGETQQ